MANKSSNPFGPMTSLREVTINTSNNHLEVPKTRIIRISEFMWRRMVAHSKRYYNVEDYDTILGNLLDCYDQNNKGKFWYDNTD